MAWKITKLAEIGGESKIDPTSRLVQIRFFRPPENGHSFAQLDVTVPVANATKLSRADLMVAAINEAHRAVSSCAAEEASDIPRVLH